jgi:hypothetical protein
MDINAKKTIKIEYGRAFNFSDLNYTSFCLTFKKGDCERQVTIESTSNRDNPFSHIEIDFDFIIDEFNKLNNGVNNEKDNLV